MRITKKNSVLLKGMKNARQRRAFALMEVLIGISLLSIAIIAISTLTLSMMRANVVNQNNFVATELSREGLEAVRNIRDTNWNHFRHWLTTEDGSCIDGSCEIIIDRNASTLASEWPWVVNAWNVNDAVLYKNALGNFVSYTHNDGGGSNQETPFSRKITITPILTNNSNGPDLLDETVDPDYVLKVRVDSTVSWVERTNPKEVTLSTELADWNG